MSRNQTEEEMEKKEEKKKGESYKLQAEANLCWLREQIDGAIQRLAHDICSIGCQHMSLVFGGSP
jgi:hypothetical protein